MKSIRRLELSPSDIEELLVLHYGFTPKAQLKFNIEWGGDPEDPQPEFAGVTITQEIVESGKVPPKETHTITRGMTADIPPPKPRCTCEIGMDVHDRIPPDPQCPRHSNRRG